jgi:hypothetical protein
MTDDERLSAEFGMDLREPDELADILQKDPQAVTFADIFDTEFMNENTEFSDIDEFVRNMPIEELNKLSDVSIAASLDVTETERESIDQFVAKNSQFDTYNDFKDAGFEEMMWDWTLGHLEID